MTPEGIEPPIFGSGIRRVAIAPWSHFVLAHLLDIAQVLFVTCTAVLAERLRRTLKARVRKSVGSIPTDCSNFFFVFSFTFFLLKRKQKRKRKKKKKIRATGVEPVT